MDRPELGQLSLNDPVVIIDPDRRGATAEGFVVKAARVWITVAEGAPDDGRTWRTEWRMRRDTQSQSTGYGHGGRRFATAEQHEWDDRLVEARQFLFEQGVELRMGSEWSSPNRQVQLASLIRAALDGQR